MVQYLVQYMVLCMVQYMMQCMVQYMLQYMAQYKGKDGVEQNLQYRPEYCAISCNRKYTKVQHVQCARTVFSTVQRGIGIGRAAVSGSSRLVLDR